MWPFSGGHILEKGPRWALSCCFQPLVPQKAAEKAGTVVLPEVSHFAARVGAEAN